MSRQPLLLRDGGMVTLEIADLILHVEQLDTPPHDHPWSVIARHRWDGTRYELGQFVTETIALTVRAALAKHARDHDEAPGLTRSRR